MRIAAVVNDDIISIWDVENRMRLAAMSSGVKLTNETRKRLAPQILRNLIDDRLRVQEASRLNIRVSDREVQQSITEMEQRNKLPPGGARKILTQAGIDFTSLEQQQRAGIAWAKIIQRRLRRQIDVGEDEVDEELRRLEANRNQPQSRLAEIFLSVDSPDEERSVRSNAERLISQIKSGAKFSEIARSFSESATAAVGGDLGWVYPGQLDPEIDAAVAKLSPGEISAPIRDFSGYVILFLRDRRNPQAATPMDDVIDFVQIGISSSGGIVTEETIATVRNSISNCPDAMKINDVVPGATSQRLNGLRTGDLAPAPREILMKLEPGQTSEPIRQAERIIMATLCSRIKAKTRFPTRQEIQDRIGQNRLDLLSRRYLRDLRRAAFVDIRV